MKKLSNLISFLIQIICIIVSIYCLINITFLPLNECGLYIVSYLICSFVFHLDIIIENTDFKDTDGLTYFWMPEFIAKIVASIYFIFMCLILIPNLIVMNFFMFIIAIGIMTIYGTFLYRKIYNL